MKTLFFLLLFLPTLLFAAGDKVNNGEGAAEQNIVFAYSKIENYIKLCFQTDGVCKLSRRQYDILSQILNGLREERLNKNQIQFLSEKQNPGFFVIDGELKAAKTASSIGSSIYINKDLLYFHNPKGFLEPLSIEQAVILLVHELGHHYGNYSHEELDLLGSKVASVVQLHVYSTPFLPWNEYVYAISINAKESPASLLLYVFNEMFDLTQALKEFSTCDNVYKESFLYNLHWVKQPEKNPEQGIYIIGLSYKNGCFDQEKIKIHFDIKNGKYKQGSLYISY